ncbi:MAG: flavohemoglobin expression-modulating QEGLA motif protein [Pirellulaceae bacterium]|nr:flavohemoglobin expression-modulating QEGLA motif protein [Pirellulaceae bacterium]
MTAKRKKKRTTTRETNQEISVSLIDEVCQRLAKNQRVRRALPEKGRLHIDRQLPFLTVYRQPPDDVDAGTERLVQGEASYLIAPGNPQYRSKIAKLIRNVASTLSAEFGAFLIVEIWSAPDGGKANDPAVPSVLPTFTINAPETTKLTRSVDALAKRLKRVKVLKHGVKVEVTRGGKTHPPDMKPLLTNAEARELNCMFIGVAVPPVFREANSTAEFPLLARSLRQGLSLALRQTYYEFARSRTTHRPPHFHALGRKAVVKAVWEIDRQLAAVSNQFDYLLQLTPVNSNAAWKQFQRAEFEKAPEFHYRPLPVDPTVLKRDLYKIPIERVEDPALQRLFQEKQEELELKLTMLRDRDTPRFLYESLQLFGGVKDDLLKLAKELLEQLSGKSEKEKGRHVSAQRFAKLAEADFEYYRNLCSGFKAKTLVSPDVSGLIVSRGKLMINSEMSLPPSRVAALLAHEVGTHLLTYYNGRTQPFQQLYSGLAGYEELQEGLAVLSEYLVDGLSSGRMRQLAARVVAVRHMVDGASFIETFRALDDDYGFTQRTAYNITMRVYRGGGLTKDAVYLRGLRAILGYVQKGGDLKPLLVGKMAVEHIPIIKELQYRKVLNPVAMVPRYMQDEAAIGRLERLRGSDSTVVDLVSSGRSKKGIKK